MRKALCPLFVLLASLLLPSLGSATQATDQATRGIQLFDSGQFADAEQFFTSFVKEHPNDPAGPFYLGRIAFSQARYDAAVEWFARATQLADGNSDYHLWLGRAYGRQAQRASFLRQPLLARKVKAHFEKAVALDPDNLAARLDLLEYYLKAPALLGGSTERARAQAEEITKRDDQRGLQAWRMIEEAEAQR
jgi:tetratricopeptide (TPR) repeat protein